MLLSLVRFPFREYSRAIFEHGPSAVVRREQLDVLDAKQDEVRCQARELSSV